MKKLCALSALLTSFTVAVGVQAATTGCRANEFINPITNRCDICPARATCNGKTYTCISGYTKEVTPKGKFAKCVPECSKNQYPLSGKCTKCPENGACDGKTVKCKSGYKQESNDKTGEITCKQVVCKSNEYIVKRSCAKCPAHATCDGKTAKCEPSYKREVKNQRVTCGCTDKQYIVNNRCVACPKGAKCNGKKANCSYGSTKDKDGLTVCNAAPTLVEFGIIISFSKLS